MTNRIALVVVMAASLTLTSCGLLSPSHDEAAQHIKSKAAEVKQELIDAGLEIVPEERNYWLFKEEGGPYQCETIINTGKLKSTIEVNAFLDNKQDYEKIAKRLSMLIPSPKALDYLDGGIQGEDEFGFYMIRQTNYADQPPTITFEATTDCLRP